MLIDPVIRNNRIWKERIKSNQAIYFRNIIPKYVRKRKTVRRSHKALSLFSRHSRESGEFSKKGMHTVCMQGTESATESLHARQGIALRVPMRYRVQHRTKPSPSRLWLCCSKRLTRHKACRRITNVGPNEELKFSPIAMADPQCCFGSEHAGTKADTDELVGSLKMHQSSSS